MLGWWKKLKKKDVPQGDVDIVAAAAADALQVFRGLRAILGDARPDLSGDPFLVGVLASHAAIMSTLIANGPCAPAVTEGAMISVLELAFDVDAPRAVALLMQFKNDAAYIRGIQASTLMLAARFGRKDLQDDPQIVAARSHVQALPKDVRDGLGGAEHDQVAALLCQQLVIEPLVARYGGA